MLFAGSISMLLSCGEDNRISGNEEVGSVALAFYAELDGLPMVTSGTDITNTTINDSVQLRILGSEFFISDVQLVDAQNQSHDILDLGYVSFTDANKTLLAAQQGVAFGSVDLPQGTYQKLSFYIGVAAEDNAKTPIDFDISSPLAATEHYWQAWNSYIFSKTEGLYTTTDWLSGDAEVFAYHSGLDSLRTRIEIPIDVVVGSSQTTALNVVVEHKALFQTPDGYLDVPAKPMAHAPSDLNYSGRIIRNFQNACK